MDPQIDIVIPVYNEGANILATLGALAREVRTPARVLICYDHEDDDTLPAVRNNPGAYGGPRCHVRPQCRPRRAWRRDGRICGQHRAHRRGLSGRRRFQCRHRRSDGRAGARRLRHRLRQPLHARRHHAGLSLAQGRAGANRGIHPAPHRSPSDQGSDQRLSHVLATRHRTDRDRVESGLSATASNCWSRRTGSAGASARFRRAGSNASMAPAGFAY